MTKPRTTLPKKRRDSNNNLIKVAKIVLKNPHATERQIAKEANIWNWTAHRQLEYLERVKSVFIEEVLRADEEIIKLAQDAVRQKLSDPEYIKTARTTELSTVAKDSTARFTLFKGNSTDEEGGLKEPRYMTDEELEAFIFSKKKWQA